jgi:hypothetical protein
MRRARGWLDLVELVNFVLAFALVATSWILVVRVLDWTARHHWPHR